MNKIPDDFKYRTSKDKIKLTKIKSQRQRMEIKEIKHLPHFSCTSCSLG